MWSSAILISLTFIGFFSKFEAKPQSQADVDSLPPLPPTNNHNWRINQQNVQQGMPPPLPGTLDNQFSPFDPMIRPETNSNWPNKPIVPVREQIVQREQNNQMDNLNEGMQREVWNNWMPDKNYGIHVGSRPDFGRGGWMARRTLNQMNGQQPVNPGFSPGFP